ncbi:MAG: hypothetical protein AB7E61_00455 [Acholeplasmataceae bacterium]
MPQYAPDLFSSDIGSIMRDEYKNFLAFKYKSEEILMIFKKFFLDGVSNDRDLNLFWLVLARIQINYGYLLDEVKEEAIKIIESNEDIKQWEEYVSIERYLFTPQDATLSIMETIKSLDMTDLNPLENTENILEQFRAIQDKQKEELFNDENTPIEVLQYHRDDSFSKIAVFGKDGKKYLKKRIEVINKLRDDIENYKPKQKKFSKPYFFDPHWKVGDIYAYPTDNIEDKENRLKGIDYKGKFILFEVIGINKKSISRIYPELAKDAEIYIKVFYYFEEDLPDDKKFKDLDYLKRLRIRYKDNIEKLGQFHEDIDMIIHLSFYSEVRKFNKATLIKLREGTIDENIDNVPSSMYSAEFFSYLPIRVITDMIKYNNSSFKKS